MTELKVVAIKQEEKVSGDCVIERLEEALEMARDGKLENVFIVATTTDKCVVRAWANHLSPFAMIGQIEDAKYEFMSEAIQR